MTPAMALLSDDDLTAILAAPNVDPAYKAKVRAEQRRRVASKVEVATVRAERKATLANRYVLNVPPMAKPRMTRSDKWRKRPVVLRYREWCDAMRAEAERLSFTFPAAGARIVFHVPMPKSWTLKKRRAMDGKPHQQTPDTDNFEKALLDCLLPDSDAHVWHLAGKEKRWAEWGRVEVFVEPMAESEAA